MSTEIDPTDNPRPSVVGVAVTHGSLLFVLLAVYLSVIPMFAAMCADFGGMIPLPTEYVFNLSSFARSYAVGTLPGTALLLFLDVRLYMWLYRNRTRKMALGWFWAVFVLLLLAILLTAGACYLPLHRMGCRIEGHMQ